MAILECGRIVNTHGVRGEVKAEAYIESALLCKLETVLIGGSTFSVTAARRHGEAVLLKLRGIDTVEAAMALKGKTITIPREQLSLPEGSYLFQDIYGFEVFDERKALPIGTLREVVQRPASMLYCVDTPAGEALIPAVKPFYQGVDFENRRLLIRTIEGMLPDEN